MSDPGPRRQDRRLVAPALAAWLAMAFATWAHPTAVLIAAAATAGVALPAFLGRRWMIGATALVAALCLVSGCMRAGQLRGDPIARLAGEHTVVAVDVEITGEPREVSAHGIPVVVAQGKVLRLDGRGRSWSERAPVVLLAGGDTAASWSRVRVGAVVRTVAATAPAERGDPAAAVLRPSIAPVQVRAPPPPLTVVERIRAGLREAAGSSGERGRLLPALVLGDTAQLAPDLVADFKSASLTHLSAVSGSNLALLLSFVLAAARAAGVRGWPLRIVAVLTVGGFVVLCRAEPSVLRAAAMGLVALAAIGSGHRDAAGARALGVAVLSLLILDPWLSRSWGFTLSVAACAGIISWGGRWSAALATWAPPWLAEAVAVPLAAQLATQPFITALSGTISVVGVAANALAGPFVGPATVLGVAAALVAPVVMAPARLLAAAGAWCAQVIIWIAHGAARLPGSSLQWPATPAGLAVLTGGVALAVGMAEPLLRRRFLVIALMLAVVLAPLHAPVAPGWPPQGWDVVQCDVGQGDALVANAGLGSAVVVDTGPDPVLLTRCLDQLGVRSVPLLILTHDHADHAGGLDAVLKRAPGTVLLSPLATPSRPRLEARLRAAGAQGGASGPGHEVHAGAVTWRTLSAGGGLVRHASGEGESSAENDASLIGMLTVHGLRVLVTGDAEPGGQDAAVATGADLSCDVLKVPHHGSGRQSGEFLTATHARVAMISVGRKNDYGHPAPRTVQALTQRGMTVTRTDERGSVAVKREGGDVRVTAEHEPRPAPRK